MNYIINNNLYIVSKQVEEITGNYDTIFVNISLIDKYKEQYPDMHFEVNPYDCFRVTECAPWEEYIATKETNAPLVKYAKQVGWIDLKAKGIKLLEAKEITSLINTESETLINTHEQRHFSEDSWWWEEFTANIWVDSKGFEWIREKDIGWGDNNKFYRIDNPSIYYFEFSIDANEETAVGNVVIPYSEIESFDELQYFTGLTTIENETFNGCEKLTSITIPNSVTSIGEKAFFECRSLTSIIIPNSVTSIGALAIDNCKSLVTATIPDSVKTIGERNFMGSDKLKSLVVGSGVTKIDGYFCYGNSRSVLETVTIKATTPPTLGKNSFSDLSHLTAIYVPAASVSAYKAATNWKTYAAKIQAIP